MAFNPYQYVRKVNEVREWQRRYLSGRDRSSITLQKCKQLEQELDEMTANAIKDLKIENAAASIATQGGLFS